MPSTATDRLRMARAPETSDEWRSLPHRTSWNANLHPDQITVHEGTSPSVDPNHSGHRPVIWHSWSRQLLVGQPGTTHAQLDQDHPRARHVEADAGNAATAHFTNGFRETPDKVSRDYGVITPQKGLQWFGWAANDDNMESLHDQDAGKAINAKLGTHNAQNDRHVDGACPTCDGTGIDQDEYYYHESLGGCPDCEGTGRVRGADDWNFPTAHVEAAWTWPEDNPHAFLPMDDAIPFSHPKGEIKECPHCHRTVRFSIGMCPLCGWDEASGPAVDWPYARTADALVPGGAFPDEPEGEGFDWGDWTEPTAMEKLREQRSGPHHALECHNCHTKGGMIFDPLNEWARCNNCGARTPISGDMPIQQKFHVEDAWHEDPETGEPLTPGEAFQPAHPDVAWPALDRMDFGPRRQGAAWDNYQDPREPFVDRAGQYHTQCEQCGELIDGPVCEFCGHQQTTQDPQTLLNHQPRGPEDQPLADGFTFPEHWATTKEAGPRDWANRFLRPEFKPQPENMQGLAGHCYFHPDRPAVAHEGFAAMCIDCYERYRASQQAVGQ